MKDELSLFRHVTTVNVRYGDLDTFGHVNNATYLKYLEEARIDYHAAVLGRKKRSLDFDLVVVRICIDFLQPLFINDQVELYTRCPRIGTKSLDFETWVVKKTANDKQVVAKSVVTLVSIDMKTGRSKLHTPETAAAIERFEKS